MPRRAIYRGANAAPKAAKQRRRNNPMQARLAASDISAAGVVADIEAGANMAATVAATCSIAWLALAIELPTAIARSWQAMHRRAAPG